MMLGLVTPTLGSSTAMAAQCQAQHATIVASVNGIRRQSLSNRTHSLIA